MRKWTEGWRQLRIGDRRAVIVPGIVDRGQGQSPRMWAGDKDREMSDSIGDRSLSGQKAEGQNPQS